MSLPADCQINPRRTHRSNICWELPGGNEDNSLWAENVVDEEGLQVHSVFVPTDEQRQAIADGANVKLVVFGRQPPVMVLLDDTPLGKPR